MYNQQKVNKENGTVLLLNKIPDTVDGRYSVAYFNQCCESYLSANIKTEKTVRHISLSPDPSDKVGDEQFTEMAQEYMERISYGNQPYIVFKHTDIDRMHIHIASTCVGIDGRKIPDDTVSFVFDKVNIARFGENNKYQSKDVENESLRNKRLRS